MIPSLNISKKHVISIVFISCFFVSFAQKQGYNWCFGDSAGINFNINPPSTFKSAINSTESAASISDNNGNLLFYSGGNANDFYNLFIWNRNDSVMQNGSNLYGSTSVTNGVLILPFFNDSNKFFVFHIGMQNGSYLYRSIIDLSFNNGLGKVTTKNDLLYHTTEITEKLIAVRHANGRDLWLLLHQKSNNTFITFLIANDIISVPYFQTIGSAYTSSFGGDYGEMEASVDGDKIAATNLWGVIDLFDFDRCTGILNNWIVLGCNHFIDYSGCTFSSKGNRLYVSQDDSLFQFDLTATDIPASMQTIWVDNNPNDHSLGQMQLGTDGKIYVANVSGMSFPNNNFDSLNMNLSVINFPNSIGAACDFQPYSFYLGGRRSYFSLPNMPNYNLGALEGSPCDTITQVESIKIKDKSEEVQIYPNPSSGSVQISMNENKSSEMEIVFYDMTGREMQHFSLNDKGNNLTLNLNLSDGIYHYRILCNKQEVKTGKLVIIK